jgi:hypothetical protein
MFALAFALAFTAQVDVHETLYAGSRSKEVWPMVTKDRPAMFLLGLALRDYNMRRVEELWDEGYLLDIERGTPLLAVRYWGRTIMNTPCYEARIQSGPHEGEIVWVPVAWTLTAPPE